jgi:hypothetical protein
MSDLIGFGDRDFDGKLVTASIERGEFEGLIHDRRVTGFEETTKADAMPISNAGGMICFRELLCQVRLRLAIQGFRSLGIPGNDFAIRVHADESVHERYR